MPPGTPSKTELAVLKLLWSRGRLSAREIHEAIEDAFGWSYSSTRKTLERMSEKELIAVETVHGLKVYEASVGKVHTLAGLAREFSDRVLELSGPLPVTAFTGSKLLNEAEMEELEALLNKDDSE